MFTVDNLKSRKAELKPEQGSSSDTHLSIKTRRQDLLFYLIEFRVRNAKPMVVFNLIAVDRTKGITILTIEFSVTAQLLKLAYNSDYFCLSKCNSNHLLQNFSKESSDIGLYISENIGD